MPDKPQPSPAHTQQGHDEMPQSTQQAQSIHEQRVPPEQGDAQEDETCLNGNFERSIQSK
jgi:hypothetical protein